MSGAFHHLLRGDKRSLEWQAQAACADIPNPDAIFFPIRGKSSRPARELCATCPVQEECKTYGRMETHGIWGGTTERERRALRREAKAPPTLCRYGHERTPGERCPTCHAISCHEAYLRRLIRAAN